MQQPDGGIGGSAATHEAYDRWGRLRLYQARPQNYAKKSNEQPCHRRPQCLSMVARLKVLTGSTTPGRPVGEAEANERKEIYPAFRRPPARADFRATSFAGFLPEIGKSISFWPSIRLRPRLAVFLPPVFCSERTLRRSPPRRIVSAQLMAAGLDYQRAARVCGRKRPTGRRRPSGSTRRPIPSSRSRVSVVCRASGSRTQPELGE